MYISNWRNRNGLEVLSHMQLHLWKNGNVQTKCMTKERWKRKPIKTKTSFTMQVYQKCHLLLKHALFWQQMAFLSHSVNPGKVREYPVASYFTCPEECPSSPLMEDSTSSRFPSMPQSRSHWVTVVHVLTRYPFRRGIYVSLSLCRGGFFFQYLPVCEFVKINLFCSFIPIVNSLQMCRFWALY